MMRGLTLWQPYAWAITNGKTVENRPWVPGDGHQVLGAQVAIHASVRRPRLADLNSLGRILARGDDLGVAILPGQDEYPLGAVTSVARLEGWVWRTKAGDTMVKEIDGAQALEEVLASAHAVGPCFWVFRGSLELPEPIPCRGYQRLWKLPEPVEESVREQLRQMGAST